MTSPRTGPGAPPGHSGKRGDSVAVATTTSASAKARAEAGKAVRPRNEKVAYLFLSPWMFGLLVFSLGPILVSLYLSFTNYNLLQPPKWIGLQNYVHMFTQSQLFATSLVDTLEYILISVPIKMIVALAIALLLSLEVKGIGVYRTVYYVPSLIGTSVAVAYLWQQMFGPDGLINKGLALVGIHGPNWLAEPRTALFTLAMLQAWQFGSAMMIFVAGLKQIPESLYEAAIVDGAGRLYRFFRITLPMLSPVIFFNLIMSIINGFTQFTQGYIVTDGGPLNATLFFALYLYEEAFNFQNMGYASALAWFLLVLVGVLTFLVFKFGSRYVYYES